MVETILVPVDGSPQSRAALRLACEEHADAEIVALHVIDPADPGYSTGAAVDVRTEPPHGTEAWYDRAGEAEDELFDDVRELAAEYDVEVTTESTVGEPAREIVDYAESDGADRIVIGSHGRTGPSRLLLGSTADLVVARSPVTVTVVREGDDG